LVLVIARPAGAQLLSYEGFDYAPDSGIATQAGGVGWASAWATGSGNIYGTNAAGSLSYTDVNGKSLFTTGGRLLSGNPQSIGNTTATPNRSLSDTLGNLAAANLAEPGVLWISFLYQRLPGPDNTNAAPFTRQANLGLFAGTGERFDVGAPNTSATVSNYFSVWGNAGPSGAAPLQAGSYPIGTSNGATFVLLRLTIDATTAADTAQVWFNWTNLAVAPNVATATLVDAAVDLTSINNLRFQAGNGNANGTNALFLVDEPRVGRTFGDVAPIPEPSVIAVAAAGGLALLAVRRKHLKK
jgi:hypothetical protein